MDITDRLRDRFTRRVAEAPGNRAERRSRGHRGRAVAPQPAATFVPRYVRRHYAQVMAVPFRWRTRPGEQGRRERRVRARVERITARYQLVP